MPRLTLLLLFFVPLTHAFIAYECADGATNYTAISLLDVDKCNVETEVMEEEDITVQLLQPREGRQIHAIACKISISYIAVWCGAHSHNSILKNGVVSRILDVSRDECQDIQTRGTYTTFGKTWNRIRPNSTMTAQVTFSGTNSQDGSCTGGYFSDGINAWENALVEGSITISVIDYYATLRFDKREVRLQNAFVCDMDTTKCLDPDNGYTYWNLFNYDECDTKAFHVLYRGKAKRAKVFDKKNPSLITYIYSVSTENSLFTLSSSSARNFCWFELRNTDHPKLLIHEVQGDRFVFEKEKMETAELDMFLYINAKFIYLDNVFKRAMKSMYQEIMEQKCELERTTLKTQLTLAITSPLEFAYTYMGGAGYTATVLGETVYVIRCQPVEVRSTEHDECVKELPVTHKNRTRFMLPRSRILQDSSTPIPCSTILKPQYLIGDSWYYSINALHSAVAPTTLHPGAIPKWNAFGLDAIATAGIYSNSQLDDLRHQIMSPLERRAKTERIAGIVNGEAVNKQGLDLSSLIDKDYIQTELDSFWSRCWNGFWAFGTTSAGIIGLMLLFRLIKFVFDTVVHGLALYELYGFTWHLVGSMWDAATTYLIHKNNSTANGKRKDDVEAEISPPCYSAIDMPDRSFSLLNHIDHNALYPCLNHEIQDLHVIPHLSDHEE